MQFGLSESQQILKTNARKFFAAECPMPEVRRLMETETAYDPALWKKMADQGFMGIVFREEHGGLGLGNVELCLLMEEMGRALVPGPYFSTIAAGAMLQACANAVDLTPLSNGEARATVALGDGLFVTDAAAADLIVAPGRTELHVMRGAKAEPMDGMDLTRKIYAVQGVDAYRPRAAEIAPLPGLQRALDIATLAIAAELVGGMQRVLDMSVEYAKTRKQFGKPIGQFQAVQHQLADSYLETESSRSAVYYAAWALDNETADSTLAVSIAKMYASDAARNVGNRGIQVQGGMGFTWENDVHLYHRRFKASETAFGDATFHRERIAHLTIDTNGNSQL